MRRLNREDYGSEFAILPMSCNCGKMTITLSNGSKYVASNLYTAVNMLEQWRNVKLERTTYTRHTEYIICEYVRKGKIVQSAIIKKAL